MSRYHFVRPLALLLPIVALVFEGWMAFGIVVIALLVVLGLGAAVPQLRFFGPFICLGNPLRRQVTLTFDDGPDTRSTPALLEVLREAGVKATFFCIGKRVTANPELAAQIAASGHLLENHTYTHSNTTNIFSVSRLRSELAQTQTAIQQAAGTAPLMFRPPMGLSNPRIFRVTQSLGLKVVGWTAGGLDTKITEPKRIVARIEKRLKPGAIILLHDGDIPAERLVATVKMLLDRLRALGYEVVRLDQMLT